MHQYVFTRFVMSMGEEFCMIVSSCKCIFIDKQTHRGRNSSFTNIYKFLLNQPAQCNNNTRLGVVKGLSRNQLDR
jgi:hypothetical protein